MRVLIQRTIPCKPQEPRASGVGLPRVSWVRSVSVSPLFKDNEDGGTLNSSWSDRRNPQPQQKKRSTLVVTCHHIKGQSLQRLHGSYLHLQQLPKDKGEEQASRLTARWVHLWVLLWSCHVNNHMFDVMPTLRRAWHLVLEKGKRLQEHSTDTKAKHFTKAVDQGSSACAPWLLWGWMTLSRGLPKTIRKHEY